MCGRFVLDKKTDDLIQDFVAEGNDFREWSPSYSIAPTDLIAIIRTVSVVSGNYDANDATLDIGFNGDEGIASHLTQGAW
jgi:putative SOS response-associated peptidase YedK